MRNFQNYLSMNLKPINRYYGEIMKVHILRVLCDECSCSDKTTDPKDRECALHKTIRLLVQELRIRDSELICVCRFDKTRFSEHVPYCENTYNEGYFDILICTFYREKCIKCIILECKLNVTDLKRDIGGNVSDLLRQIRKYNALCNKEKSRCNCREGPFKFIIVNKDVNISKSVKNLLEKEGWNILKV